MYKFMAYKLNVLTYIAPGLAWEAFRIISEGDGYAPAWTQLGSNSNNWISPPGSGDILLLWDSNGNLDRVTPDPSGDEELLASAVLDALYDGGINEDYPGTIRAYYDRNGESMDGEAIVLLQNQGTWSIMVLRPDSQDAQIGASEQRILEVSNQSVIFSIPSGEIYYFRPNGGGFNNQGYFLLDDDPKGVFNDGQGQPIPKPARNPNESPTAFLNRLYAYHDQVASLNQPMQSMQLNKVSSPNTKRS